MSAWNNLGYAARTLVREPGFAAVAVMTVAFGVGANTAIFSIVNGVLLRPLPYSVPERLVSLREVLPAFARTYPTVPVSARHFTEWRQRASSFERLSVVDPGSLTLTGGSAPEQIDVARVSADIFRTLDVQPEFGRAFQEGEDRDGTNRVTVLSHALWQRRFQADSSILGKPIQLDGRAFTVVGVLPAGFPYPALNVMGAGKSSARQPDLFVPAVFSKEEIGQLMGMFNYNVIARLKPDVPIARARAELNQIAGQLVNLSGEKVELQAHVEPLLDSMVGQSRRGLMVLLGAVGAVLLIMCVNLANLMLARGERQSRESAIRIALGADRGRLVRQALSQALWIAVVGGALGLAVAAAGLGSLVRHAPADLPRLAEVRLDGRVLFFALALTAITGLLFGAAPAWRNARIDPQGILQSGGRTATGSSGGLRFRNMLVMAEVALSAVLLVTAALLISSFLRLMRADKGFSAPAVLSAQMQIPRAKYGEKEQRNRFYQRALARLAAHSGVLSAAVVTALPLAGETWLDTVSVPGDPHPGWEQPVANIRFISPDYLRTMGIPLRSGRTFRDGDRDTVAIVSERLAVRLWHNQNPVGRHLLDGKTLREVIGVAGDVRSEAQKAPAPMVYRPYWDWAPQRVLLVARAAGDPRSIAGAMREAVRHVDPDVPLAEFRTMQEVLEQSVAQRHFQMLLAAAFACTALLLAGLGIYGVVSYAVTRRTHELGIRIALGAQAAQVYGIVLRQAMLPVMLGLLAGLAGALAAGRLLANLLYEVSPRDPAAIAIVVLLLGAVGLVACFLPARRAVRVDPLVALRQD